MVLSLGADHGATNSLGCSLARLALADIDGRIPPSFSSRFNCFDAVDAESVRAGNPLLPVAPNGQAIPPNQDMVPPR